MQPTVLVPLANGFEEIEAITIIDVLSRANINVITAGIDSKEVVGAHGVVLIAKEIIEEEMVQGCDMVVLPGGMPGAENLRQNKPLRKIVQQLNSSNKPIGAICASPWVLWDMGVLKSTFTCYPSFEKRIPEGEYLGNANVVKDQNILTASGPATAMEFALEIVKSLCGDETYNRVKSGLLFR